MDRKVVGAAGTLYLEAPRGRKRRSTIYPARTAAGYLLAGQLAARAGRPHLDLAQPPNSTRAGRSQHQGQEPLTGC